MNWILAVILVIFLVLILGIAIDSRMQKERRCYMCYVSEIDNGLANANGCAGDIRTNRVCKSCPHYKQYQRYLKQLTRNLGGR